jgi:type I restriction enzyme, S subunit
MIKIPNGWSQKQLGEIADTQLGKMLNKSKQNDSRKVPYLRTDNVHWGRIDLNLVKEMEITPEERFKFMAQPGDLLICEGGASGRTAIWNLDYEIGIQNHLHRVRTRGEVSNKYLMYYMEWLVKNGLINHLIKGVTISHLSQSSLRSIGICYPGINEQHEIVEILEDHLSRLDVALADVKQAKLKAAQFKVSFLRNTFSGDATWNSIPMKQLGQWGGGGTPSKANEKYWANGTVPWLSPKDMGPLEITHTVDKITEDACLNSTVKKIPVNSVVFVVRSGILERKLPMALTKVETTLNQDMKALTFSENVRPKFGFYAMLGLEQDILRSCRKSGTTVASINTESLMNYEIKIPSLPIQAEILDYVETQLALIDNSMPQVESVLKVGNNLRRSLLQAAFTGQLTNEVVSV